MRLDAIAIGKDPPLDINVIIEVPVGGEPIKYELDKASGTLVVDRFLYTPMRYPGNYGFVPPRLYRRPTRRRIRTQDVLPVSQQQGNRCQGARATHCRPIGVLVKWRQARTMDSDSLDQIAVLLKGSPRPTSGRRAA